MTTVFHPGELLIQTESGVDQRTNKLGNKLIRDHIIDQHKEFFESLSYIFIALHDNSGRPWLSMMQGPPGFASSPSPQTLKLNGKVVAKDVLDLQADKDRPIGIVGLDLSNRRRNRLNGRLNTQTNDAVLSITVDHSFGNCPKYIQLREFSSNFNDQQNSNSSDGRYEWFDELDANDTKLIKEADTLFIASSEKQGGDLDASHRGGKPGFIKVDNKQQLWFNDYPGNNYFQTFGNIHNYPNIGLMLIDFKTGDLLLLSGKAHLEKTQQIEKEPNFVARRCYFTLEKGMRVKQAIKGTWSTVEMSPFLHDDLT